MIFRPLMPFEALVGRVRSIGKENLSQFPPFGMIDFLQTLRPYKCKRTILQKGNTKMKIQTNVKAGMRKSGGDPTSSGK